MKKVDVDRLKLIAEVKELLAPCSREIITSHKIACCIWFDKDDDDNECAWIAKIEETKFDEAEDITSMLAKFPGYNDETYWLPIIFATKWLVFQPNEEILLNPKYKNLYHKKTLKHAKIYYLIQKNIYPIFQRMKMMKISISHQNERKKGRKKYTKNVKIESKQNEKQQQQQ